MAVIAPSALNLAGETFGKAVAVAPDFWVIASRHHPGTSQHTPEINNRSLIFKLRDASDGDRPVLLVANAIEATLIPEVKRIAAETGAPIRYIIAAGAGHNLTLPEWHDALPDTKILVGPVRIPRVATGKKLAGSPRFIVYDPDDPLPMFRGQVEAVSFDGIGGFKEIITPKEGGKDSRFLMFKNMITNMPPKDPHDELWLYHVASRTAIGGENLGWRLSKEQLGAMGFMFRMMMKAEQVYIMTGPRPVLDKARVAAHWRKILDWPMDNLLSYHDTLGTGQVGGAQAALRAAVEKVKQLG